MKIRTRPTTVVALLLIGIAFAALLVMGLEQGSMYYLEVREFAAAKSGANENDLAGEKIRLHGAVVAKSIRYSADHRRLTFALRDTRGPQEVSVGYLGTPPDLFGRSGVTIVAEGIWDPRRDIFEADKLLVKCPSKYRPKEGRP